MTTMRTEIFKQEKSNYKAVSGIPSEALTMVSNFLFNPHCRDTRKATEWFPSFIQKLVQSEPGKRASILLLLLLLILVYLEVTQLIALFAVGNYAQPVT